MVAEAAEAQRGKGLSQGSRLLEDECRFGPGPSDPKAAMPCCSDTGSLKEQHVPKCGIMETSAGVAHCRLRGAEEGDRLERWAGQSMETCCDSQGFGVSPTGQGSHGKAYPGHRAVRSVSWAAPLASV